MIQGKALHPVFQIWVTEHDSNDIYLKKKHKSYSESENKVPSFITFPKHLPQWNWLYSNILPFQEYPTE